MMLLGSFKDAGQTMAFDLSGPKTFHPENYLYVIENGKVISGYINNIIYTVGATVFTIVCGAFAGIIIGRRNDSSCVGLYYYFLLGLTLSLPLYVYRLRGFWLVLAAGLFCAGFAGLDEYHQMFVAGRSPALRDVAIDTAGSITGIYMTRIIGFIGRKTIFAPLSMEKRRERKKRRAGA